VRNGGILEAAKQKLAQAKTAVGEKVSEYENRRKWDKTMQKVRSDADKIAREEAEADARIAARESYAKERVKLAYAQGRERARAEAKSGGGGMLGRLRGFGIGARMRGETKGMASGMTGIGSGVNLSIGGGMRQGPHAQRASQGLSIGLGSSMSFGGSGRGIIGAAHPPTQVAKRRVKPVAGKTIIIRVR
jgi:hypothetical protein